jgi:hydroxyethylthiazole kinase-like uncharacterized protein yjeF
MKNVFFNKDILAVEKKIIDSLNIPSIMLMENAGANSSSYIQSKYNDKLSNPVIILAGKGNNAGDGFVIARHLANAGIKSRVALVYPEKELKGDAKINLDILKNMESPFIDITNYDEKVFDDGEQIVVDAIFGVGFKGDLDDKVEGIVSKVNSLKSKTVIALDVPSGLERYDQEEESMKADITIAMGVKKFDSLFYNGKMSSGEVETVSIGIPEEEFDKYNDENIYEIDKEDVKDMTPVREATSHKYSNGKLFVLAGAKGYTGAACLSAQSGLRAGSGAVTVGFPESLDDIMEKKLTDVVKLPLPQTEEASLSNSGFEKIREKIEWSDVTLIGPGIGRNDDTMGLVRNIISECEHKYVIDADGLFALNGHLELLKDSRSEIVLTPHTGEFASLLGITTEELLADFYNYAKNFAKEHNVVLVLKNAPTVITDGKKFFINPTGHQNLGTVGTGDVLAGIIASFYAQGSDAMQSSIAGVYLHGFCGDVLYEQTGDSSTIASDLIPLIPKVKHFLSS